MKYRSPNTSLAQESVSNLTNLAAKAVFGVFAGFIVFSIIAGGDAFRGSVTQHGYFLDAAQTQPTSGFVYWVSLIWGSIAIGGVVLLIAWGIFKKVILRALKIK